MSDDTNDIIYSISAKAPVRQKIAEQVNQFIAQGGTITSIPAGMRAHSGESTWPKGIEFCPDTRQFIVKNENGRCLGRYNTIIAAVDALPAHIYRSSIKNRPKKDYQCTQTKSTGKT